MCGCRCRTGCRQGQDAEQMYKLYGRTWFGHSRMSGRLA
uniref:Uncharacterized protein n=1 Tax=Faecalibaculum rodentium TaxID=1702221 RepID=A0A140DY37_9FIRM|nr:hypothetical protein AALO17_24300 [Faecalibaculum rodentium]